MSTAAPRQRAVRTARWEAGSAALKRPRTSPIVSSTCAPADAGRAVSRKPRSIDDVGGRRRTEGKHAPTGSATLRPGCAEVEGKDQDDNRGGPLVGNPAESDVYEEAESGAPHKRPVGGGNSPKVWADGREYAAAHARLPPCRTATFAKLTTLAQRGRHRKPVPQRDADRGRGGRLTDHPAVPLPNVVPCGRGLPCRSVSRYLSTCS